MPTLLLPVLPKPASRPHARVLHPQFRARRPQAARPSRRSAPCRDASLLAICLSGVVLAAVLVGFSIVRDTAALDLQAQPPAQPMAAPLSQ